MTARTTTVWTFVITSIALFMVSLDNLVVTTAIPVIRKDLNASLESLEWTVNAYTLTFAVLLLTGRRARRPLRPPAHVRDRHRRLHARLGRRGARAERRGAQPRPRRAGPRRRDRDAADADDPQRRRAAGEARARARRLGRDQRSRGRVRARRRRRRRAGPLVAVDLLAERPDRHRCSIPLALSRLQETHGPRRQARPAGPRARQRRSLRDRLGPDPRQRPGLGEPGDRRLARGRRSPSWRRSSPGSCGRASPMLPMRFFRKPAFALANVCVAVHVLRDVRLDLPALAVLPDRAGLLAARRRACGSCRGRSRRCSSLRSPVRCRTGSPAKTLVGIGLSLQAVSLAWIGLVSTPTVAYSELIAPFMLAGVGMSLFFAPMANIVLSAVRPEEEGQASGANNAIRELGGVFGVAVLAAVFANAGRLRERPGVQSTG